MIPVQEKRYAWRFVLMSIAILLIAGAPRAQTGPLLPSVDLRRDVRLDSEVWPADFNGDGITDLVASRTPTPSNPGGLHVVLGRGDGTFGTPIVTNVAGRAIQVAEGEVAVAGIHLYLRSAGEDEIAASVAVEIAGDGPLDKRAIGRGDVNLAVMREVANDHLERAIPGHVPHRRLEGPVAIALQHIHESVGVHPELIPGGVTATTRSSVPLPSRSWRLQRRSTS